VGTSTKGPVATNFTKQEPIGGDQTASSPARLRPRKKSDTGATSHGVHSRDSAPVARDGDTIELSRGCSAAPTLRPQSSGRRSTRPGTQLSARVTAELLTMYMVKWWLVRLGAGSGRSGFWVTAARCGSGDSRFLVFDRQR
jgi:hypothetical protein